MIEPVAKPRIAAYLRISTLKQDEAMQRTVVSQWIDRQGVTDAQWFVDKGVSGATMKRPQFQELQAAVFRNEIDTVVMYSLDRLARTMLDGLMEIHRWEAQNVKLVFVRDCLTIEPDNPIGKVCTQLMTAVCLAIGEAQRERICQHSRDSHNKLMDQQRHVKNLARTGMRPKRIAELNGMSLDRVKRMIAAPKNRIYWQQVGPKLKANPKRVLDLRARGLTWVEVARIMKVSRQTAMRYGVIAKAAAQARQCP